jgi:hypothetical protein
LQIDGTIDIQSLVSASASHCRDVACLTACSLKGWPQSYEPSVA